MSGIYRVQMCLNRISTTSKRIFYVFLILTLGDIKGGKPRGNRQQNKFNKFQDKRKIKYGDQQYYNPEGDVVYGDIETFILLNTMSGCTVFRGSWRKLQDFHDSKLENLAKMKTMRYRSQLLLSQCGQLCLIKTNNITQILLRCNRYYYYYASKRRTKQQSIKLSTRPSLSWIIQRLTRWV